MSYSILNPKSISQYYREIDINHVDLYLSDSDVNANFAAKFFLRMQENRQSEIIRNLDLDNKIVLSRIEAYLSCNPLVYYLDRIPQFRDYHLFSLFDAEKMILEFFGRDFLIMCSKIQGDINSRCKILYEGENIKRDDYNILNLTIDDLYQLKCPFIVVFRKDV